MNRIGFFIILLLLGTMPVNSSLCQNPIVEICDNALDDDGDGLIDLNDDDCNCPILETVSLFSNPSFENLDCCPEEHSTVDCASGWAQGSEGTPDLANPCGWNGGGLNIPQPIPDGVGYVGIIDGIINGDDNPRLKEYITTCLEEPLAPDKVYQMEFHLGFLSRNVSPEIEIAVFGATNCSSIPFGIGDIRFGCPSNSSEWIKLGGANTVGENEWKKLTAALKVDQEINAIAVGPDCRLQSLTSNNTYFLLDQLILAEVVDFDSEIKAIGNPCAQDFRLELAEKPERQFQWYKDGIALVGATQSSISNPLEEGQYSVRVLEGDACFISNEYRHLIPFELSQQSATICNGEVYRLSDQILSDEGIYFDTLVSSNNCDSIIRFQLSLRSESVSDINVKIIEGETYTIGGNTYDLPGNYQTTLPSAQECDSIINIELSYYNFYIPNVFSPNNDGSNDHFNISRDADLITINELNIYDRWGNLIYIQSEIDSAPSIGWNGESNGKPVNPGVYTYVSQVTMSDNAEITLSGMITLIR